MLRIFICCTKSYTKQKSKLTIIGEFLAYSPVCLYIAQVFNTAIHFEIFS